MAKRETILIKLTYAKHGPTGVLRRYQHSKFGPIETVTMWRDPGAHIIRIETERHRKELREIIDDLRERQGTG